MHFSGLELVVLLILALLIFGHKLPSVARSLGLSVSEFKKGVREGETELVKVEPLPANPAPPSGTSAPTAAIGGPGAPEKK